MYLSSSLIFSFTSKPTTNKPNYKTLFRIFDDMLRLNSEITIGTLRFNFVTNLSIQSSWETFTDTANMTFPAKLSIEGTQLKDFIKVGDAVAVKTGYFPNLTTRFEGYVSKIVPDSPIKIMCEDESWQLKRQVIDSYSKKNVSLETLITDNYSGEAIIADTESVGTWRIAGVSLVKIFQELRSKFGLYSWFRNGVLNTGLPFTGQLQVTNKFKAQFNIIDASNLQFTTADELNTVSHGFSIQSDGKKIELYSKYNANGDIVTTKTNPGGDLNTYSISGITEAALKEIVERRLPNLYYTGYRGSFTCFGEPVVKHGDIVDLSDKKFPERDGKYLVKAVGVEFGQRGYRQEVELDRIVS